ncbi:hypothetical protein N825_34305 [Skermanella stibiiresistens SB22]|uniref:Flagellin n=1 Tax=Skermanella stibiiresistens SB22 TaxID=1385369 RepID=W9GPH8_9PROT|nr:flagellin [Skermanella stibiiresistens]EWY35790.1 hypothetical protein N825_34305 [Skermanella stibiiresistens SB22]
MTSISTNGQFMRVQTQNMAIQQRMTDLTEQVSSGKKTSVYGGLGADARQSIDLRGQVTELDTYQKNIASAQLRVTSAVETMERINDVARDVREQLTKLTGNPPPNQSVIQDIAKRGYDEVAQLLNTKVEGRYIFAGSDTTNPPFPDAAQFFTDVQTEVNAFAANGAPATIAATTAIATDDTYFSTALQGVDPSPLKARVDRNLDLSYQVRANGPESPPPPAGQLEPFREILRGLATAANLTYDTNNPGSFTDYNSVLDTTRNALDSASKNLDSHVGILGSTSERMKALDSQHDITATTAKTNLTDIEDVDMADAISKLDLIKTQLQASYKVTSTLHQVNLIDFL